MSNLSARSSEAEAASRWLVVVLVCVAQFMVVLDATIVNVALPSIRRGLGTSLTELQWVITMYTLMFGGFILLGGRAGDLIGRKRVFSTGIILFSVASLLNGLAQSPGMLIAGRGLQGLGGALLAPAVLAIITTTFTDGKDRATALAIWSGIAAGGGAVGLLLGGLLTDLTSWRWIFFVNVPIGAALLLATARYVPESRSQLAHRTFDLPGAAAVTGGLLALVFGIVESNTAGWRSIRTVGSLALGGALLAAFLVIESRSPAPLVRLSIFRLGSLAAADLTILLASAAVFSTFFFVSLYIQETLGYSPLKAGAAFLPFSVGTATGAAVARRLVPRLGVRTVPLIGLAFASGGMIVLAQLPVHGHYASDLLTGLLPIGLGLGLTFVPITLAGTRQVSGEDAGLASGLLNTAQQIGGSIGLAILATLAASRTASYLDERPGSLLRAQVSGFHVAFTAAAVLLGAAWIIVAVQPGAGRRHSPTPVEVPPEAAARAVGCAQCAPVLIGAGDHAPIRGARHPDSKARHPDSKARNPNSKARRPNSKAPRRNPKRRLQ